ncbi:MAG: hypothetical protein HOV80_32005 [Polyangiaceae bacterium]|nr:hypothetical protein [Polyangiaceae bacterium]
MKAVTLGFFSLIALSAACSTDVEDLFSDGSDNSGGAGGATTTVSVTSTGSPTTSGPSTNTSGPTTTGPSTTGPGPTTTTTEATTMQSSSMSTGPEPDPTVACRGAGDCSIAGGGVCCWSDTFEDGECADSGQACLQQIGDHVAISCQLPDQCPNQVCCAHRQFPSNQSPYESTACQDDCPDPDRILCDGNAPNCPGGMNCVASTLLPPGYFVCSPN